MSTLRILALASVLSIFPTAPALAGSYTVKSGDTIHAIARRHGISSQQLMSLNGITDPTKLRIGQTLKLNAATTAKKTSTSSSSGGRNHTVQAGDTLYSIARRHGMSVKTLTAMNPGLNPNNLKIGQKIALVSSAKPTPAPVKKTETKPAPAATLAAKKPKPAPVQTASTPVKSVAQTKPVSQTKPVAQTKPIAHSAPPKPEPKPAPQPEEASAPAPNLATISTVTLEKEISFGALASQHRTTPSALNALNGWDLKPKTVLARGSEIYIPKH
ncbi:MAG: LysM peptidoglycan-binding domain-containing protein [Verrucomicrobiota bacterium JB023]|nr:LysM peptidoglycan-binding domain-containing protein [Verrucomicrobiota bacterium JB023]